MLFTGRVSKFIKNGLATIGLAGAGVWMVNFRRNLSKKIDPEDVYVQNVARVVLFCLVVAVNLFILYSILDIYDFGNHHYKKKIPVLKAFKLFMSLFNRNTTYNSLYSSILPWCFFVGIFIQYPIYKHWIETEVIKFKFHYLLVFFIHGFIIIFGILSLIFILDKAHINSTVKNTIDTLWNIIFFIKVLKFTCFFYILFFLVVSTLWGTYKLTLFLQCSEMEETVVWFISVPSLIYLMIKLIPFLYIILLASYF